MSNLKEDNSVLPCSSPSQDLTGPPPKKPRKTPTCSCCGGEKVKGHVDCCLHTNQSCRRCKAAAEKKERTEELEGAFRQVQCVIRDDSSLCKWFIEGVLNKKTGGKFKTANDVALRIAQLRYLREGHCVEFESKFDAIESQVEEMVNELAEREARFSDGGNHGWSGHYRGIYADAYREVYGNGFYSSHDVETDMVDSWKDFPDVWPWMAKTED